MSLACLITGFDVLAGTWKGTENVTDIDLMLPGKRGMKGRADMTEFMLTLWNMTKH